MTGVDPSGSQPRGSPLDLRALRQRLGVQSPDQTSKFVAYTHLLDACRKPGCPACRCLDEVTRQTLDALVHELGTDRETPERLDRSAGFCAWHAQLAPEEPRSALGSAIVHASVLRRALSRLRRLLDEPGAPRAVRWLPWTRARARADTTGGPADTARCPLCERLAPAEAGYLRTVLDFVADREFAAAYGGSAGLCLPHLDLALARFPTHRNGAALVRATLPNLERLRAHLTAFVDTHERRAEAPFTSEQAAAWSEALRAVTGAPGLFGPEIPRPRHPEARPGRRPPVGLSRSSDRTVAILQERLDALAFENRRLTERIGDLTRSTGDESSRAAGLEYRLRLLSEDRKVLELNLAGERGAARTWERQVRELEAEVARLRRQLGLPEVAVQPPASAGDGEASRPA